METTRKISETGDTTGFQRMRKVLMATASIILILMLTTFIGLPASAHCDSYDGPVIKDAMKALETNNVSLVLKWVNEKQEQEIVSLFSKTYSLKKGDKEIYAIVEKHFFETLVRFHRETEGAPYTGLKPSGTTKIIVQMSDQAIANGSADDMINKLNAHIDKVIREKYQKVSDMSKVKDTSTEKGREYVKAYVDYTHTLEAIHDIIDLSNNGQSAHKH
jgi:hypothetical protein